MDGTPLGAERLFERHHHDCPPIRVRDDELMVSPGDVLQRRLAQDFASGRFGAGPGSVQWIQGFAMEVFKPEAAFRPRGGLLRRYV